MSSWSMVGRSESEPTFASSNAAESDNKKCLVPPIGTATLVQRGLPSAKDDLSQDRIVAKVAQILKLDNAATRADIAAQTGLNLDGSAGLAFVWPAPSSRSH